MIEAYHPTGECGPTIPLKMATTEEILWEKRIEEDDSFRRELSLLFKQLRAESISGIEYFQDKSGSINEKFYASFVHLYDHLDQGVEPACDGILRVAHEYDFNPTMPYNGYRSMVKVTHKCSLKILQMSRYISTNRESFMFRGNHYSKELEAYVITLGQLRACLYYLQKLLHYCPDGSLFSDEESLTEEEYKQAEKLMGEVEGLSQESFYGRCLGFQVIIIIGLDRVHRIKRQFLLIS